MSAAVFNKVIEYLYTGLFNALHQRNKFRKSRRTESWPLYRSIGRWKYVGIKETHSTMWESFVSTYINGYSKSIYVIDLR